MTNQQIEEIKKIEVQLLHIQTTIRIFFRKEQEYQENVRAHMTKLISKSEKESFSLREAHSLLDLILDSLHNAINSNLNEQKEVKK